MQRRKTERKPFFLQWKNWLAAAKDREGESKREMAGETRRLAMKVSGQKEFFYLDFCGNVPSLSTTSLHLTLLCSSTECVELGFFTHTHIPIHLHTDTEVE